MRLLIWMLNYLLTTVWFLKYRLIFFFVIVKAEVIDSTFSWVFMSELGFYIFRVS